MKKKIAAILMAITMSFNLGTVIGYADDGIVVTLNGSPIQFDVQPQLINDRTMVPLRKIFEAMGASVDWNGDTQTVTATKGSDQVIATINNTTIYVNGETRVIDVPPMIVNDRTLVPARFVAESFGATVNWDGATQTVIITTTSDAGVSNDSVTYSHFGINYDIPYSWGEPVINGEFIYYYPTNGMLTLSQLSTPADLDAEGFDLILSGMASSFGNYQLLSTGSVTLSNGAIGYSANFTGNISERNVACKMVSVQVGTSVVSLTYANFDISNTDTRQFDDVVKSITFSEYNNDTPSAVISGVNYYPSYPDVPDFGAFFDIENEGNEPAGACVYDGSNLDAADIYEYLSVMEDAGFTVTVGGTIFTCQKENLYVDIGIMDNTVIVTITRY